MVGPAPQPLDHPASPYPPHVLDGTGYVLGRFRCPAGSARWRAPGWIGDRPHVVLPRTAVAIGADGPAEVRTVNEVVVYDRDTTYRRELVSAEGDRCPFVAVGDRPASRRTPASTPIVRRISVDPFRMASSVGRR